MVRTLNKLFKHAFNYGLIHIYIYYCNGIFGETYRFCADMMII